jgi:hypothetical protein
MPQRRTFFLPKFFKKVLYQLFFIFHGPTLWPSDYLAKHKTLRKQRDGQCLDLAVATAG